MFNIIDELRAVVGDYQTVVLAFLATDLYYVGNGWNLDWTLGKSDYNIIVQSWHRYAQLDPTTFQCVLSHVTRHELGHVFRAAEGRKDPHGRRFFDDHCTNHLCDMYQTEGPVQTVIDHAIRVSRQPDSFCEKCRRDIVEQAHRWDPNPTDPSTVTWLYGADGSV